MNIFERKINNLKKLRLVTFTVLSCLFLAILSFFVFLFFQSYQSRQLEISFFEFSYQTILYLLLILILVFAPLVFVINRRFSFLLNQLLSFNEEDRAIYLDYTKSTTSLFTVIPQYLISRNALIIIGNFKFYILKENQFDRIVISRYRIGTGGSRCIARIYSGSKKITDISYTVKHPPEIDFLKKNISLVNDNIVIEENF